MEQKDSEVEIPIVYTFFHVERVCDEYGPVYDCPKTLEELLETNSLELLSPDLESARGNKHLTVRRILRIPKGGEIRRIYLGDGSLLAKSCGYVLAERYGLRKDRELFDPEYNPIIATDLNPRPTNYPESAYFLWLREREEWIAFVEKVSQTMSAGIFDNRLIGPFSADEKTSQILNDFNA